MKQEWNQKHVQILVMIEMKRINVANVSSFIKEAEKEVERKKYRLTVERNTEGTGNKRVFRLTRHAVVLSFQTSICRFDRERSSSLSLTLFFSPGIFSSRGI